MRYIDSHHHLWDPATRVYPWMDESVAAIKKRFTPADLRAAAPPSLIGSIVVQAVGALEETEELLRIAAGDSLVMGVVGWVDLTAPDVADTLARLRAGPGGEYLVGIRHQVHDEPDPDWLLRADVGRGLRAVADTGLTFDLLVRSRELPAAATVARRLPELDFVLDHVAKPAIAQRAWEPWNERLTTLAACPNVWCKLSGLVTEAEHDRWEQAHIEPYLRRAIHLFTPQRLLFGSDWPVCLLAAPYSQVFELASLALRELSEPERAAVFAENAQRLYLRERL